MLPQILFARLGPTQRLKQFVELNVAARSQLEGRPRRPNDADELVVVGRSDVVHLEVGARDEPDTRDDTDQIALDFGLDSGHSHLLTFLYQWRQ